MLTKGTATRGGSHMAGRRHGEGKEKDKGTKSEFLYIALMNPIETPGKAARHGKC